LKLALDTNRYTDLMRGVSEVIQIVESADEIVLPFVVVAELHAGFQGGSRRAANEAILDKFLRRPSVGIAYPDHQTLLHYADLGSDARRRGRVLPHNDLWTAALCLQHGFSVYSRDKHFDYLPQITRV
jgi:predicted nucleic acid-binding protein